MKLYFANVITICCLYSPMMAALPEAINHSAATRPTESTVSSKPTDSTVTIQQADTVRQKTTQLDEVVVNSDWQWRDDEKYVFLPQKRQKNIAQDATSLLERMYIPLLVYPGASGGSIKGRDGGAISIFINGVQANDIDLRTFWPKQCIRVEYFENPSDPRFSGHRNVVNFIMPVYEWGGITKLNGYQIFPNQGSYNGASKFTYRRMTYGAVVSGGYERDHLSGSETESEYRDLYYKGIYHDLITESERSSGASRSDNLSGAFNAVYSRGTTTITHQVSLNWSRDPGSYEKGTLLFSPSIIEGNDMLSRSRGRRLSPVVSGRYVLKLPHAYFFDAKWQYSHNHNTRYSSYAAGEEPSFFNASRENVNSVYGHVFIGKFKQKWGFNATVRSLYDWYATDYDGTYDNNVRQQRGESKLDANIFFYLARNLKLTLSPRLAYTYWTLKGDKTRRQFTPGASFNASYEWPKGGNSSYINCSYFRHVPAPSEWTDAMIRQSELFWIKGNPNMKASESFNVSVGHSLRPLRVLDIAMGVSWYRSLREKGFYYYAASPEEGGIVREYYNTSGSSSISFNIDPSVRLLNNNLIIYLQFSCNRADNYGHYRDHLFALRYRGGILYYFGNFAVGGYFSTKQKNLLSDNTHVSRAENYELTFKYGNGNFTLSTELSDFLHTRRTDLRKLDMGIYSSHGRYWVTGRQLKISMTYTFDYGKKIQDRSTINAESDSKTSVIGS